MRRPQNRGHGALLRPARLLLLCWTAGAACSAPPSRPGVPAEPAGTAPSDRPAIRWTVESGFGPEADWVPPHLQASARVLTRLLGSAELPPPAHIEVFLENDPEAAGLAGWSGPTAIGFTSDLWPEEPWRLWITTHELTNLFAAHYACGGGFPSDWWSNGRSPFPVYVTGLVLRELGHGGVADWLRESNAGEPDHELYWHLHERFGFEVFARTLTLLRADGMDLGAIEPPWPWPSARRSAYTIAYLSIAAGEDLTATVLSFGIGREPPDWRENHLQIPFEEYTIAPEAVARIVRERERLFGPGAREVAGLAAERERFRSGAAGP